MKWFHDGCGGDLLPIKADEWTFQCAKCVSMITFLEQQKSPTSGEWISVEKQLPEEGVQVLTLQKCMSELWEYRLDYIVSMEMCSPPHNEPPYMWACRLQDEHDKVHFWMPLPKPPES